MAGDLATLRAVFASIPTGGQLPFLRIKAEGYVAGADALGPAVRLDGTALRPARTAVRRRAAARTPEGGEDMNGRYAAVWRQPDDVTNTIRALTDVLARAGRRPVRVISPPDRSSQILGRAVATALGVDFGSQLVDGTFDEPCSSSPSTGLASTTRSTRPVCDPART